MKMAGVRGLVAKHDWDAQAPMLFQQDSIYLINVDSWGCLLYGSRGLFADGRLRNLRLHDNAKIREQIAQLSESYNLLSPTV